MGITIKKSIVHEIPKGRHSQQDEIDVRLSTELTSLEVETRRFITDNMVKFALKQPRDIKKDPEASSPIPDLVTEILNDVENKFVGASQKIATHLYRSQTASSPSGILIISEIINDGRHALLIMKAEHQEGMRLKRDDGTGRFDLEHLNELIVGQNSKIYKVAVMSLNDEGLVVGQLVDQQNGVKFADFFLSAFLGCQLADRAEVQTKTFMDYAIKHFNDNLGDPAKASRYAGALSAYMYAPGEDFQPSVFADNFLEAEDRDEFLDSMPDSIGDRVIRKDLKLVAGGGSGVRIIGQGFAVTASNEAFSSGAIMVDTLATGETVIRLSGELKRVAFGAIPKGSK